MPFRIIRNDITLVAADAIVNTANPDPVYAGGTDEAVYKAAGARRLLEDRKKIGAISPGEAAITEAYRLNAKYIIHTVGPVWQGGNCGEFDTLASCYRKSLMLAKILECRSIAFPLISTGVYGFPKDKALEIALREFRTFLDREEMDITLVVYDRRAFELSSDLVSEVEQYIDEKYVKKHLPEKREVQRRRRSDLSGNIPCFSPDLMEGAALFSEEEREDSAGFFGSSPKESANYSAVPSSAVYMPSPGPEPETEDLSTDTAARKKYFRTEKNTVSGRSLQDLMRNVGETFQVMLLRLIDERGLTDPEVYKGANLDRKLFSKIRCNADYKPGKKTVLALAISLKLSLDETVDLLSRAGYAFSPSSKSDVIVKFCIESSKYNIYEVDALLFKYGEQTLG